MERSHVSDHHSSSGSHGFHGSNSNEGGVLSGCDGKLILFTRKQSILVLILEFIITLFFLNFFKNNNWSYCIIITKLK
jgi:hypothetical protein